jgi:[protein-PII] uridylyltransferase
MQIEKVLQPANLRLPTGDGALVSELRGYVERHRKLMAEQIKKAGSVGGRHASAHYSSALDGLLSALFGAVRAVALDKNLWNECSLSAVGSYGRGTLAYSSDLDVRLLGTSAEATGRVADALLYPLWDSGFAIGHQVVTVEQVLDLAADDLPTATNLLDWRSIAGAETLIKDLDDRAFSTLFGIGTVERFLAKLADSVSSRTKHYGDSVYLLEPDVRNGTGGVRDADVLHWIARARWRTKSLKDLVRVGVLIPRELVPIEDSLNFMMHVRNILHSLGERRNDRLSFDRQEQVSAILGYGSDGVAVERLMSDYYRHARVLSHAREMLFLRAAPTPARRPHEVNIGKSLKLINGQLSLSSSTSLKEDPAAALRLYYEAVRRNVNVYPFARTQIARLASSLSFCHQLRESSEASTLFIRLCLWIAEAPFAEGSVLRELHEVGLLTAMVPEFMPVVGRVHHDVYHVYTVDVHSLCAVDRLRSLCRGELAEAHPIASRLAAELARPQVLFFAMLLHDVGKDIGGPEHSERGAELAQDILARLGLEAKDIAEIQHLIRQHLVMYHTATRRDLEDQQTIEAAGRIMHGHTGLRELFLLTVCDVATTSPDSWTSWKAKMLDELYLSVESWLDTGSVHVSDATRTTKASVCECVKNRTQLPKIDDFLAAMPERYILANEPSLIAAHSQFVIDSRRKVAAVGAMRLEPPYSEFAVVADDRPGLLAMIAAAIAAEHVEIVAAQVYSFVGLDGRPRALDLFWLHTGDRVRTGRTLSARIENGLISLLLGATKLSEIFGPALLRDGRYERPTPPIATSVSFDNRGASRDTIIEITTRDRVGLLYEVAHALQEFGLVISLAKINTEGTKVADVFYVTEADGSKVTNSSHLDALREHILSAINSRTMSAKE